MISGKEPLGGQRIGTFQIMGKDLVRKETGRSRDRLDAVVIGLFASMEGMRTPQIRFGQARS